MVEENDTVRQLSELKARQERLRNDWAVAHHEALIGFFVGILPRLMVAERCSIFVVEPGTERIWVRSGTGLEGAQLEAPREGSVVGRCISGNREVIENGLDRRGGFHQDLEARTGFVTRNIVCVPIRDHEGGTAVGAIEVLNSGDGRDFGPEDTRRLEEVAQFLSMTIESVLLNEEVWRLSERLNTRLERARQGLIEDANFIAASQAMREVLQLVKMVAATPVSVFIQGENGTGKEVIARMIHLNGERRERPFVAVNCAGIPENLMESEFFGFDKGAFTGAVGSRPGRFEEADGGTLFLDEIADMPLSIQPKFLRAIQEGEGMRLGSNRLRHYDLRIVSATNKDLRAEVAAGRFREDLYHRLFAVEIRVPPLRERREDIGPLALAFQEEIGARFHKRLAPLPPELLALFENYPWPGNVRQLRREMERLIALTPEGEAPRFEACSPELRQFQGATRLPEEGPLNLPEQVTALEVSLIKRALNDTGGNKQQAARLLGITRQGLHKKLNRYGLQYSARLEFE